MTSSIWIKPPPILKPNPSAQRINKMMIIVQSMIEMPFQVPDHYRLFEVAGAYLPLEICLKVC